jgi:hypothetical protein
MANFSDALYCLLGMKKAPFTAAGFIISPVYLKGSISKDGRRGAVFFTGSGLLARALPGRTPVAGPGSKSDVRTWRNGRSFCYPKATDTKQMNLQPRFLQRLLKVHLILGLPCREYLLKTAPMMVSG